ncbi:hypothetical protein L208DRAFT_1411592, partial [Tricholoma matsutake]
AHVIKEWGGTFRTDYLKIGPIHYRFLQMIPFHLGSATVSKQLEPELVKNLHLRVDSLAVMHRNTDRPNIFLVDEDLAFIIKKNLGPRDTSFWCSLIPEVRHKQVPSA